MQKFKFFGFKSLMINGHSVYTCNIAIDRIDQHPVIQGVSIWKTEKLLKSGKEKLTTTFSYITTDSFENERMLKEIGLFLEQHAERKLYKKYSWAHKQELLEVPEMEFGGELMF